VRVCATVMLLAPALASAADTIEPRAFGYTVGDVLERRVLVDPAREGRIDLASLPKPGRAGRWFALRAAQPQPDGVRLVYQILSSPEQPASENLPSLRLQAIAADGRARPIDIGPFTVTMAPVALFGPYDAAQAIELRPDLDPAPIDTRALGRRVAGYVVALTALLCLLWLPPLVRRHLARRSGPFMRAWRSLRRRPVHDHKAGADGKGADEAAASLEALRRLHQAFDEAAGVTLALDNLDRLFEARPQLAQARTQIESMLAASRAAFFGQAAPPPRARTAELARTLAHLDVRAAA
jgi:mxaA protein